MPYKHPVVLEGKQTKAEKIALLPFCFKRVTNYRFIKQRTSDYLLTTTSTVCEVHLL